MEDALDVWIRFVGEEEEEAEAEANVFSDAEGEYYVQWYLTSVGLVTTEGYFSTHEEAREWLRGAGFQDFTS